MKMGRGEERRGVIDFIQACILNLLIFLSIEKMFEVCAVKGDIDLLIDISTPL